MSDSRSPKTDPSPAAEKQFDAYHKWLGIPPDEQPPNHYRLLGIRMFESDAEVIQAAAERQVVYLRQCAVGPYGDISQKLLNEVSAAQVCLLVPEKRAQYDAKLKAETAKKEAAEAAKSGGKNGAAERAEGTSAGGANRGRPSSAEAKPKKKTPQPEQIKQLRTQATELMADGQTAAAVQVLQKIASLRQPAFADDAKWARDELAVIDVDPEQMREQADAAFRLAQRLMRRNDYEQAVQLLDEIPPKFRSTKFQHLHTMARDSQDEVDVLVNDLEQAIADDALDGMLPTVKRLLELKPGHQLASRLYQQLTGKAAPKRRRRKKKAAVWGMIPAIPGLQVGELARSGGSLALWAVGLVVVVGGLGWGIVQLFEGGEKTLGGVAAPTDGIVKFDLSPEFLDGTLKITIDGEEITPEQLQEGLKLSVGEHELIVTKDGKEIHRQTIIAGGVEVASINLTYDGSKVATAVETPLAEEPLNLPAGDPGEVWVLTGHDKDIRQVTISPNGRYLVSSSNDGTSRLWDLSTGTEVRRVPAGRYASAMDFSADGKFLLTNGDGGAARLIDLQKGQTVREFPGHNGFVSSVAFLPDGKSLVTAGQNDGTVRRWNLEDGKEQWVYRRFGSSAAAVEPSADGARIAAVVDGAGVLLNAETGEQQGLFDGTGPLAFSRDGRLVAGTADREIVRAWDATNGVELATWPKNSRQYSPVFSADLRLAAAQNYANRDQTLEVWDTITGKNLAEFKGHKGQINCVAISDDGQIAATGGRDSSVRLWRLPPAPGGDPLAALQSTGPISDEGEPGPVRTLSRGSIGPQVPAEGDLIASVDGGIARAWDWRTGVLKFRSPGYNPTQVEISDSGRYLLTAGSDGLHLWDLTGEQPVQRIGVDGYGIRSLDISPDNRTALATVETDRAGNLAVIMLDLISGRETLRLPLTSTAIRPAAEPMFSPAGGVFALPQENSIVLIDGSTGQETQRLEPAAAAAGGGSSIVAFGFSGDGRRLVAADSGRSLRVYEVDSGALVSSQLRTRIINSLAVSNTGRYVIATAPEPTLIDLAQNRDLPAFTSDSAAVQKATFLANERFAAFRTTTGNLQVWRLPSLDDDPYVPPVVTRQEVVATPSIAGEFRTWQGHRSGGVQGLDFSGDGRTLASSSGYDGEIRLWEVTAVKGAATAGDIQPQEKFTSTDRGVGAIAFSPDSSKLIAGLYSGGIFEVDLKNNKETKWSESAAGTITSVAWTPDGSGIVTTTAAQQKNAGPVRLWDRQTGKVRWQYDQSTEAARSAAVTSDGSSALVDLSGVITRLNLQTGEQQGVITGQKLVTVSPDGSLIATTESAGIHLWDAATGREQRRLLGYTTVPEAMAFTSDNRYLIVGSNAAPHLRLWDVATGQMLLQKKISGQVNIHALAVSPDGQHVAVGLDNGTIGWWSLPTIPSASIAGATRTPDSGSSPAESSPLSPGPAGEVARIELPVYYAESPSLSPDAKYVIVTYSNRVKAWEVETQKLIFKSPYYRDRPLRPAITPGGREVLIPFASEILVFDLATGGHRKIPRPNIQQITLSPDGTRMLLLSSASRKAPPVASIVDIASGEQVGVLAAGQPKQFSSITWSPDGSSIAAAIGEDIELYAADSGTQIRRFTTDARKATVYDVAFEANGLRLFSWGRDNLVRLWNVSEGTEIRSIRADARSPVQLTDDARIVGSGNEGLVLFATDRLKEDNNGRPANNPAIPVPAAGRIGRITGLAVATGQPIAVTTVSDGTIRIWRLPAAE